MYLLLWLLFGALAGWIANQIVSNNRMGLLANIAVGLIGSFLGGWIASLIGLGTFNTFSIGGLLIAILGAVIFLAVLNLISGRKSDTDREKSRHY
jgi:uncharacterized membrane protein YeaQ/YmgE (transglycosylase-associated protein family)